MSIAKYIKEIGRGKEGARSLAREPAADLMGQVLDGVVTDLEMGAFCLAMRVKGESIEEMLGFLDATHARLPGWLKELGPCVVLPSYNGARKLPLLTPLLAALLAQRGFRVLVHGMPTDSVRTTTAQVWALMGWPVYDGISKNIATNADKTAAKCCFFVNTGDVLPGLARLLAVRQVVGVRNSAHSLVKLMNPTGDSGSAVIGSYTHPEYLQLMGDVLMHMPYRSMLLRGTEGEPVADARRRPQMEGFAEGRRWLLAEAQQGALEAVQQWGRDISPSACASLILAYVAGEYDVPPSILSQVAAIDQLLRGETYE